MSSKKKNTDTKADGKPALVPKLRFPGFRGAWDKKTLETLGYFTGGGTPSKDNAAYWTGEIPWISSSDLNEDSISQINISRFITKQAVQESATKLVPAKSILLISRVGVGKLAVSTFPLCTSQDFTNFTPTDADPLFLAYLLKSQRETLLSFNQGTSIKGFTKDNIASLRLGFPSLAEQHKIAECLSSVDEVIAAQARKVDALKTHKKGLMQQLFPREGETQPRLRFPEFRNDGDWLLTTVGGLVETGCLFPPKDGNHGNIHPKSSDYVARGIPFIMASDLNGGLIEIENCHFISKEQADTLQKGFAKEGDVLLSHKGTVGEVAVVRHINTPYLMLTPQVTYYRVKDRKKLSNEFLAQLFVADAFQSNLVEVSGGGTRAYIGITEQVKLRVQLPEDVTEQQRIADCLSRLDALITAVTKKLEALKRHKRGLMQQLFPSPEEAEA